MSNIPYQGIKPSYIGSLAALTIVPVLLLLVALIVIERSDLD